MKVIGMHGRCEVDAGDATPVVQREDGMVQRFCFSEGESSPIWYDEDTSYDWGVGYLNRFKDPPDMRNAKSKHSRVFCIARTP
jgi:hypothetical protein